MPIRFSCASCQQPIEVDDNWAGQAVACPYCRRVVTAPRESSWPSANVPVATPVSPVGAQPTPPLPPGPPPVPQPWSAGYPTRVAAETYSAGWALFLACFAAALSVASYFMLSISLMNAATRKVGAGASQEALMKAVQETIISQQAPVGPGSVTATAVAMFCGIAAMVLAVRSLVRREGKQVMAVAACLIAALVVVCQGMLGLFMLGQRAAAG